MRISSTPARFRSSDRRVNVKQRVVALSSEEVRSIDPTSTAVRLLSPGTGELIWDGKVLGREGNCIGHRSDIWLRSASQRIVEERRTMSVTAIVILVVIVVAILVIAIVARTVVRRRQLQARFGPEYDRMVDENPNRAAAESDLRAREKRHAELDLKALSPQDRDRYLKEWTRVQAAFVEDPSDAVNSADALVSRMMRARGYPTGDFDDQLATLSVEHAQTLDHYRAAHGIFEANLRGQASTEQLRQALVHYRVLATDLLDANDAGDREANDAGEVKDMRSDTR